MPLVSGSNAGSTRGAMLCQMGSILPLVVSADAVDLLKGCRNQAGRQAAPAALSGPYLQHCLAPICAMNLFMGARWVGLYTGSLRCNPPGGRLTTRKTTWKGLQFDHGCQFIRPVSDTFKAICEEWRQAGDAGCAYTWSQQLSLWAQQRSLGC